MIYDFIIFNIIDKWIDFIINGWFGLLILIFFWCLKFVVCIYYVIVLMIFFFFFGVGEIFGFMIGLFFIVLGIGGIKLCVLVFGGD